MTGDRLRALASAANPGPWEWDDVCISPHGDPVTKADARLIALAPELALLLADTIDYVETLAPKDDDPRYAPFNQQAQALLARFRGLGES